MSCYCLVYCGAPVFGSTASHGDLECTYHMPHAYIRAHTDSQCCGSL